MSFSLRRLHVERLIEFEKTNKDDPPDNDPLD